MTTNWRALWARRATAHHILNMLGAALLTCVTAGMYLACTGPIEYVSAWAYKACDADNGDLDCIDLPDSYCEVEIGWCRCWNKDGTKAPLGELPDQVYCRGACIPLDECPFT